MLVLESPGETSLISIGLTAVVTSLPWLYRWTQRNKTEARRAVNEATKADAERMDSSYRRLETENSRLWNRVSSLEMAVTLEREAHEKAIQEERDKCGLEWRTHEQTKRALADCERTLYRLKANGRTT